MPLLELQAALARLGQGLESLAASAPSESEAVPLEAAVGRILAQEVAAPRSAPPGPVSAMDGFAFAAQIAEGASESAPVRLRLAQEVAAGARPDPLRRGEAVRLFTGSLLPQEGDGAADAVLPQEDAEVEDGVLVVRSPCPPGRWVRAEGRDFRAGDLLLRPPRCLTPRDIALAAAAGHGSLRVRPRIAVAILSSGEELVVPEAGGADGASGGAGGPVGPEQVWASSRPMLAALVRAWGGAPEPQPVVSDDPAATAAALVRAALGRGGPEGVAAAKAKAAPPPPLRILVTTGGAGGGGRDWIRRALASLGTSSGQGGWQWEEWFHRVAVKPGMPVFAGRLARPAASDAPAAGALVLGMPGNPVSSFVCAALFLRPLLAPALGWPASLSEALGLEERPLAAPLDAGGKRHEFLRAVQDETGALSVLPDQDSSLLRPLHRAGWLISRPPGDPPRKAGATLPAAPLALLESQGWGG